MFKHIATTAAAVALTSTSAMSQALFGTQYTVFDGELTGDLTLLDMEQDGDLDIAVCTSPWLIHTLENLGNGQFGPPSPLELINVFQDSRGIQTADLDGDGRDDIVCASTSSERASWWRSQGDGTFSIEQRLGSVPRPLDVATGDVDLDGDIDVVVSSRIVGTYRLYENLGGGTFVDGVAPPGISNSVYGVTLGLVDGDSFPDLVSCTDRSPGVFWARGNGDGTFQAQQPLGSGNRDGARAAIVDLNGDGWNDIVATFFTGDPVVWFPNSSSGFLAPQVIDSTGGDAFALDVADMDRDGDVDLVIGSSGLNRVRTYENLGGGAFGPPGHVHGFKEGIWGVRFGNLDDDFDPEIVSAAQLNRTVIVNENRSSVGSLCCYTDPNSTGARSKFNATGSPNAAQNEVLLVASRLPENQLVIFMASLTRGRLRATAGARGTLCLDGAIGRFDGPGEVQTSGPDGRATLRIDTQQIPQPSGAVPVVAGSTWYFQGWHRDSENGQPVSHYTQALRATFQ